jgi:aryl-alcohol dehydrogenase-like predicted oxidoreductase
MAAMEQRRIGRSDLAVSIVGLGCNNFGRALDLAGTRAVLHEALDLGITLFDTGDVYGGRGGSETLLGALLGPARQRIVIATKFGKPMDAERKRGGASRAYIFAAIEASLARLKTDWIDLYQLHEPDPHTPIEETLQALEDLKRQGKIRVIGCSNMPPDQLAAAQAAAASQGIPGFACCEDEYSLLNRAAERALIPMIEAHGLGLLPFYPLASGMLTGKYRRDAALPEGSRMARGERDYAGRFFTAANWHRVEALERFAASRGRTLLELAIGWLAQRPPVASVIAGATRPQQVAANVAAAGWRLAPDELAEIDRLSSQA